MNIKEYVARAKQVEPKLEGFKDAKAVMLLREVFKQIAWEVNETLEGKIKVPGLGLFNVGQVERKKEGQSAVVKRVIFKAVSK